MSNKTKISVVLLAASAAFFTSLIGYEGYSSKPYKDTGGVATIGIGSTQYENGTKVKMTDKPINQKRAVQIAQAHITKDEQAFRKSMPGVKLSQVEYDVYLDFTYNFGQANWRSSSMLRNLKAGQYVQACKSLLKWKYVAKRDCSIRSNNCYGVWTRQLSRYDKCMEAQ
ncbi:lysozyme [Acinetobacter venetianus]|uniref:Lysozyme n=1 Tax=Acinetobacter venetianus TaxID=52133 RepID=A0A150HR17_9GAMM|nr:lysozyme [Acinetobacter venetianus]KXZ68748.1 Lysozyme RrrD [Acinetobacter venetianus]